MVTRDARNLFCQTLTWLAFGPGRVFVGLKGVARGAFCPELALFYVALEPHAVFASEQPFLRANNENEFSGGFDL